MADKLKIISFAGSLREKSTNKGLLRAIKKLSKEFFEMEVFNLKEVPLFNEDLTEKGFPPQVASLRDKVRNADGIIIASPEYNFSMTAVTKNAVDWISRAPDFPAQGKPVGIVGASYGPSGTMRSQLALRQSLIYLNVNIMSRPELYIALSKAKFDKNADLKDKHTLDEVNKFVIGFKEFVQKHK